MAFNPASLKSNSAPVPAYQQWNVAQSPMCGPIPEEYHMNGQQYEPTNIWSWDTTTPTTPTPYKQSPFYGVSPVYSFSSRGASVEAESTDYYTIQESDLFDLPDNSISGVEYDLIHRYKHELKPYKFTDAPDKMELGGSNELREVSVWTNVHSGESEILCGIAYNSSRPDAMETDELWFVRVEFSSEYWQKDVHNFLNKWNKKSITVHNQSHN
eukprot:30421_1